jgi:hypothetical protein
MPIYSPQWARFILSQKIEEHLNEHAMLSAWHYRCRWNLSRKFISCNMAYSYLLNPSVLFTTNVF